jgi:REP element-mobilizing transposase RayT
MARRPRGEYAPGIWHVYARGNNREAIFRGLADLDTYSAMLARAVDAFRWRCLSYCLMPNHVHLLVETTVPNLGDGMRHLHGRYAARFNTRHGRSGHLFGGRFGGVWVTDDAHLWTVARYIAMNPVEARLCPRPEDWRWSSHGAVVRDRAPSFIDIDRLLELFSAGGGDPRRRYADFVDEGRHLRGGPTTSMPTVAPIRAKASAGGGEPAPPDGNDPISSKKRSMPDGVNSTRIRAGDEPSLTNACGVPRGTKTNEPAGAAATSSPSRNLSVPSITHQDSSTPARTSPGG